MFFFVKVNEKVINVFYPSLKMRVKVFSINMKSDTLKMIFLTVSINIRFIGFKNNNNLVIFLINKFVDKIHKQE